MKPVVGVVLFIVSLSISAAGLNQLFNPPKSLPDQFRMTTNIQHLKNVVNIKERDDK